MPGPIHALPTGLPGGIWGVLERNGLATFLLVIVGIVFWKIVWPAMIRVLEKYQETLQVQIVEANKRADRQEDRLYKVSEGFLAALNAHKELIRLECEKTRVEIREHWGRKAQ